MIDLRKGDCLELMKDIPDKSIDAIICDLPYGITQNRWDFVFNIGKEKVKNIWIVIDNTLSLQCNQLLILWQDF